MRYRTPLLLGLLGIVIASLIAVQASWGTPRDEATAFVVEPLNGQPLDAIGAYAIGYATMAGGVLEQSETSVALARSVTLADLPALGLPKVGFGAQTELFLVILKGNFDPNSLTGTPLDVPSPELRETNEGAAYVGYLFDGRSGFALLVLTSAKGQLFRTALNDPSLPDDGLAVPDPNEPEPLPVIEDIPLAPLVPYGATVAPITLPTVEATVQPTVEATVADPIGTVEPAITSITAP
jgi:hypothetical protein